MAVSTQISSLYTSILRRDPDDAGGEFWTGLLNAGTSLTAIRDALLASSEVTEQVSPIVRIYEAVFGRTPDQEGLTFWVNAFRSGTSLEEIASGFVTSAEFDTRFGTSVDRDDFIEALYTNVLGRSSDAEGKAFWSGTSLSNAELLVQFANSPEFVTRSEAQITQFLTLSADGQTPTGSLFALDAPVTSTPLTGSVIDGKIAGATVGVDLDGDGVIGPDEPTVTTDAQGNFVFPEGTPTGTIIASGGTDISTGLPFSGKMSAPAGSTVVTPVTTLINKLAQRDTDETKTPEQKAADAQAEVKALLGLSDIEADLTNTDFVTESTEGDADGSDDGISDSEAAKVYGNAVKIINFVKSTASAISGSKEDGSVSEEDASDAAFDALVTQLENQRDSGNTDANILNDADALENAARSAADSALGDDEGAKQKVSQVADQLGNVVASGNNRIDDAITNLDPDSNGDDSLNALIQVVKVGKAVQGEVSTELGNATRSDDPEAIANTLQTQVAGEGTFSDDLVNGQDVGDIDGDGNDDDPDTVQDDDILDTPVEEPEDPVAPPANNPPTFTTATVQSVVENTSSVTNIATNDTDGAVQSVAITGGADAARFTLDQISGELAFVEAPDFEAPQDANGDNVYQVEISATDDDGATTTQSFDITVSNAVDGDDIIAVWQELDSAYTTFPALLSTGGKYNDATLVDTTGEFSNTLSLFGDEFGFVLDSDETTAGQLALAVNTLFVKLGNIYVEFLGNGGEPLLDIAKDRGGDPAPGQSYHDNILGNLGDGPISSRFGSADAADNVDIDGDSNGDIDAEPRSPEAILFGERPYFSGNNGTSPAETIAWDIANGITRTDIAPLTDRVFVVSANRDDGVGDVADFATIQEAVNAATAGDTIVIGAGSYEETLTVDKELTFVGAGSGQTVLGADTRTAVTIDGAVEGTVSFDGIDFDGASGAGTGLTVTAGAGAVDLAITNGEIRNFDSRGIWFTDNGDATVNGSLDSLTLTSVGFSGNGTGPNNTADIKLFGYDGDVTMTDVTFTGASGVRDDDDAGRPDSAMELIVGLNGPGAANPAPANAADLGNITLTDVVVSGQYHKNPIALFNFGEVDGLTINSLDLSGAESLWKLFNIDGTTDTDLDASGFNITLPGNDELLVELQGEKTGQADVNSTITGTSGNDQLNGKQGDDDLSGDEGNDLLIGGLGSDNLDGGAGTDAAFYAGSRDGYEITQNADSSYTVTDTDTVDGNRGVDRLVGIEAVVIDGISYELDANSPDTSAYAERFSQGFETDNAGFFIGPDDWSGGLVVTASGTNGIDAADGSSYAVATQTDEAGGVTGPFTRFDGYSTDFGTGFSTQVKIYLDPTWNDGAGFDWSVAANGQDGNHQRDFIFHVTKDADTGTVLVGASNNTKFDPRNDLEENNHTSIDTAGWYTFEHNFYENAEGDLEVALSLYDDAGDWLFTEISSNTADDIAAEVGGNRYGWFTNIDVNDGIAIDSVLLIGTSDADPILA